MSNGEWWLPLSRAAEIVRGHLARGQDHSSEQKAKELDHHVAKALRSIFASGEVRTLLRGISPGFEGEFLLRAEVAAGEFFSIDLDAGYLMLPNVGGRYEARLHSKDLHQFVAVHMPLAARAPSHELEDSDLTWLVEQVKQAERGSKTTLQRRAVQMRGMSVRKFLRLWPIALVRAERPELSDPGKPQLKS